MQGFISHRRSIPDKSCGHLDCRLFRRFVSRRAGFTYVCKTDPVCTSRWPRHLGGEVTDKPFTVHLVHKQILHFAARVNHTHGLLDIGPDKPLDFVCGHELLSKDSVSRGSAQVPISNRKLGKSTLPLRASERSPSRGGRYAQFHFVAKTRVR